MSHDQKMHERIKWAKKSKSSLTKVYFCDLLGKIA
jgi:hypothetical protein